MTIEQVKSIINAIIDDLRAKYEIDWLDYTIISPQTTSGFYRCDIYVSKNSHIKTDYVYIRINNYEDMVKKAFELSVINIVSR